MKKREDTIWVGVGCRGKTLFVKEITSKDVGVSARFFDKEKALIHLSEIWNEGIKIISIKGPYKKSRVCKKGPVKEYFDTENFRFTSEKFEGLYKGWFGMAHIIEDNLGHEAAMFFADRQKSPSPTGPKKATPKPKIVSLAYVKEI